MELTKWDVSKMLRYYEECKTREDFLKTEEDQGFSQMWLEIGLIIAGFVLTLLGFMAGAYAYAKKKYPRQPPPPNLVPMNQFYNSRDQTHRQPMHSEPVFQPHRPTPSMQLCQFEVNGMRAPRMGPPTPYSVNQSFSPVFEPKK